MDCHKKYLKEEKDLKRLLSLLLSLVLLVSFASLSFAAVTVGGNLRVWYQNTSDENDTTSATATPSSKDSQDSNGFRFDRLALTFASELSAVDGFKGEVQFRQTRSKNENDIRVDNAYYYQKGMFFENDEMDIGYIQQLPFKGSYNAIVFEDLANAIIKDTNSVGIKYSNKITPQFDFSLALLNAKNQYSKSDYTYEGFDYGVRMNYAVIPQLKIGLAYVDDVTDSDNYKTAYLVDATYDIGSFRAYVEYVSSTITAAGKDTDLDPATYLELSYKVNDPLSLYIGGTSGLGTDKKSFNKTFPFKFTDADADFQALDNWMVVGAKYQLAPSTALQAEYVSVDGDKDQTAAAVRLMVSF
jgi:hypothetical protein